MSQARFAGESPQFDETFNRFEERELARWFLRSYLESLPSEVDSEIGLWLHHDRISQQATDEDIATTVAEIRLHEAQALYGERVERAAERARRQGNHSALRCFVREVRRAKHDLMAAATSLG